jgi:DNA-binding transcriptional ArsR family regulator
VPLRSSPSFPLKAYRAGNPADFQSECIELFAEVVYALGLPRSVGQIYGLLYASSEPLSFSDIVERLDISKGSASQGLQLLRTLGAINLADAKRQAPGGRREAGAKPNALSLTPKAGTSPSAFGPLPLAGDGDAPRRIAYEPELGLRRLLGGIIRGRIEPLAGQGRLRMRRLRELAEATADSAHKEFQLERVEQLETWRRQATLVMPVLKTLLAVPRR